MIFFQKISITKNVLLKWYFSMKKALRKIQIIFDIESWQLRNLYKKILEWNLPIGICLDCVRRLAWIITTNPQENVHKWRPTIFDNFWRTQSTMSDDVVSKLSIFDTSIHSKMKGLQWSYIFPFIDKAVCALYSLIDWMWKKIVGEQ